MLDYPPLFTGPLFQFSASKALLVSPDQYLSPALDFSMLAHTGGSECVNYLPLSRGPLLQFPTRKAFLEGPDQ